MSLLPLKRLQLSQIVLEGSLTRLQTDVSIILSSDRLLFVLSVQALERLARSNQPWALTVSFLSPHPPMICPWDYLYEYHKNRNKIFVPPSYRDPMEYSPYTNENGREQLLKAGYGYNDKSQLQELWAVYYGLVEDIDSWVGSLLNKLDEMSATSKTLVVFTSDHGEMLGAP